MDLGELWKTVHNLLEDNRIDVPWDHLRAERHDILDEEIRAALEDGRYEFHALVDGRYVATYVERRSRLSVVVLFELWEEGGTRRTRVLTAFHRPASRCGRGGR
jgi:hypothetical protein